MSGQIKVNNITDEAGSGAPAFPKGISIDAAYKSNIVSMTGVDINCAAGNYFKKSVSSNSTFTISNVPSGKVFSFSLEVVHTAGTITWFSGVRWPGGVAPSLTTSKTHLFMFVTNDGGSTWRGTSLLGYQT